MISAKLYLNFNYTCIRENLLPIYTNFKIHDATARNEEFVQGCRRQLIERQISQQEKNIEELIQEESHLWEKLKAETRSTIQYDSLRTFYKRLINNTALDLFQKHERTLFSLYGGTLFQKQEIESHINISTYTIDPDIQKVFSLGMNCHLKSRFDNNRAKIELERLYNSITTLEKDNKITIEDKENVGCELKRFGLKKRINYAADIVTKEHYKKISNFVQNKDIVTRKADKSNTFVIMNRTTYDEKINHILSDKTKYTKKIKDPSAGIKTKLNKLIQTANARKDCNIPKISEHFEPGYIYGNPKTHKSQQDPPLRPIVSQIGTVTYSLSKWLNKIITP